MSAQPTQTATTARDASPKRTSTTYISAARVRRHLDKNGVNELVNHAIKRVKQELKPLVEAEQRLQNGDRKLDAEGNPSKNAEGKAEYVPLDEAEKARLKKLLDDNKDRRAELEREQAALTRERARFSNESSTVLAIVLDELTRQLVTHAMDNVLADGKKIIQVDHLRKNADCLDLYPLVHALPSWHNVPDHVLKKKKEEDADADNAAQAAEDETSDSDKTSFSFYVSAVCRSVIFDGVDAEGKPKKSEKYGGIRVSTNIREYCNILLIEFIRRLTVQLQETLYSQDVKTITSTIIMNELRKMLIDGQRPAEKLVYSIEKVPDPAQVEANKKLPKPDPKNPDAPGTRKPLDQLPKIDQLFTRKVLDYSGTRFGAISALVAKRLAEEEAKRPADAAEEKKIEKPKADVKILREFSLPVKAKPAPHAAPAAASASAVQASASTPAAQASAAQTPAPVVPDASAAQAAPAAKPKAAGKPRAPKAEKEAKPAKEAKPSAKEAKSSKEEKPSKDAKPSAKDAKPKVARSKKPAAESKS